MLLGKVYLIFFFLPNYFQSIPFFITFIGLEFAVSWIQKRKLPGRINDGICSLSLGILSRLPEWVYEYSLEVVRGLITKKEKNRIMYWSCYC